jgi:DNA polymerase
MESGIEHHTARALLEWQVELGATEAIGDTPVDRYGLPTQAPHATVAKPVAVKSAPAPDADPVAVAEAAARAAGTLEELCAALGRFDLCDLKKGARNLVFADGVAGARVMIIGEAPGRDEDREGRPFVGRAGQLLDRMLAEIGLNRQENVYITNVLPWRPPQNRDPHPQEIAMLRPFLVRHVELAAPEVIVAMGNISCQALLGKRGITRLRGTWAKGLGHEVLPMFHPAYLLRKPEAKRDAWADLLELDAKLRPNT